MDYDAYTEQCQTATALLDTGDAAGALAIFERLIGADISDLDKAMMCHNAATVLDRLGRVGEALRAYDRAIAFEWPYSRCDSTERKAIFLAGKNDWAASLALYEQLLLKPYATEQDKARFRANIAVLRQRGA
jgi:tetratricopeptide (TPR) repeat protein